ncbi:DUF4175 family protein [Dokdonella sp.]|uniref:DUF4175 family protein n=1 Tax=Dokdonella sp. TaxID=2291710 RepID=UPI003528A083
MSRSVPNRLLRGMRARRALIILASALPMIAALLFAMRNQLAAALVIATAVAMAMALAGWLWFALRGLRVEQVVRRLDASMPLLDDSSDLLLRDDAGLSALEKLQRRRISDRLDGSRPADVREAWPWRRIALLGLLAAGIALASLYRPEAGMPEAETPSAMAQPDQVARVTSLKSIRIDIEPPAYTGLPSRRESTLDVEAAQGSTLHWKLAFSPEPGAASLQFHDGSTLPLRKEGEAWAAETELGQSTLYRIVLGAAPPLEEDRLYRLDAIADQPPTIRVILPEKTLSQVEPGQQSWQLEFEVSDDYGVGDASLGIILAQGSGEQVTVSERSERLRAESAGSARQKTFRRKLSLGSTGITPGDDLIVRLSVRDLRKPQANVARSASYILRWPAEMASESEGVEGIVQKVLPAYFRSQRQIIIDTEALLAERDQLDADRFLARSDTIGVDQKILRLRYGQFLGEEFESGGGAGPEHQASEDDEHKDEPTQLDALPAGHSHDDGHDHGNAEFGVADDVLAEFGHAHDHAEAATLLDPETKKILKSALAEMWQAELHLRLGEPARALPFENRALAYIKQVQQASRIYLARVGLELPPVDESRRLSGKREGLRDPRGVLMPADAGDEFLEQAYRALSNGESIDLVVLEAWVRQHESHLDDPLDLIAALDVLRREPACDACRESVLDALWALLPVPPAETPSRAEPDAVGKAYLDGLGAEVQP